MFQLFLILALIALCDAAYADNAPVDAVPAAPGAAEAVVPSPAPVPPDAPAAVSAPPSAPSMPPQPTPTETAPGAPALPDLTPVMKADLDAFYTARTFHAAWNLADEAALKKAQIFITSVETLVIYHGLDKEAYPIEAMRKAAASGSDGDKKKLELLITSSLMQLAHDLHGDAVNLGALYTGWDFHRAAVDIPALLNAALTNGKLENFFSQLAPQNKAYGVLAKSLQAYQAIAARGGWPKIANGLVLHPGDIEPRVAQVRARLSAEGYVVGAPAPGQENIFDEELSKVLTTYQVRNGLLPDGNVGPRTQEALNVPVAARIGQIRANMERWRHMPDDFPPDRYAVVNIPDFTITITEDGKEIYRGLVVDGRADRPTPFIDSRIVNMVINPSWHVPEKLARQDILPKLRKDPRYLEKLGFVIKDRDNDPAGTTINWNKVSEDHFPYQLRQNPGDMNSLGQLKFNFDNPFAVYMHGTPHQELFAKAERNFSSGCVRLEDPEQVGEVLLTHNKEKGGWTQQRIADEIDGGQTRFVTLAKPMKLYFLYWDVFPGDDGQVNFRKDIYGYDQILIDSMKDAHE